MVDFTFPLFMKKLGNKLTLNKETLSILTEKEMGQVKGGYFLSIGCYCSKAHDCTRVLTKAC